MPPSILRLHTIASLREGDPYCFAHAKREANLEQGERRASQRRTATNPHIPLCELQMQQWLALKMGRNTRQRPSKATGHCNTARARQATECDRAGCSKHGLGPDQIVLLQTCMGQIIQRQAAMQQLLQTENKRQPLAAFCCSIHRISLDKAVLSKAAAIARPQISLVTKGVFLHSARTARAKRKAPNSSSTVL